MLCAYFSVFAQEKTHSKGLAAGDRLPQLALLKMVNYKLGSSVGIDHFRGKLLILDFWSTYCGACLEAMPHLDSLQHLFGDRVMILPVAFEKQQRVTAFWRANGLLKNLHLPSVIEDTQLAALFPHKLLPHDVWISADGTVLGSTEATDVTKAAIRSVLAGKGLPGSGKQDALNYRLDKPLLTDNNGGPDSAFRYRSILTGFLKGVPASLRVQLDTVHGVIRVRATNVRAMDLYGLSDKKLSHLPVSRICGSARAILVPPAKTFPGLDTAHLYCYELILPGRSVTLARRSIREDLDRFFAVSTIWQAETGMLEVSPLDTSFYQEKYFSL